MTETEPYSSQFMKAFIRRAKVMVSNHAKAQMLSRGLDILDVRNVLKANLTPELDATQNGTCRYKVSSARITVVVAVEGEDTLVIVTAWRNP